MKKIIIGLVLVISTVWLLSIPITFLPQPHSIAAMRSETVLVRINPSDPDVKGFGSGINLGGGLILTARHVAINDDEAGFNLPTDKRAELSVETITGEVQPAHVVFVSEDQDFAIIATNRPLNIPVAVLECRAPVAAEPVILTGNPGGFIRFEANPATIATTIPLPPEVLAAANARGWQNLGFTAGPVFPGMSGGGVFDKQGGVIGVVVASLDNVFGGFIPSSTICAELPPIAK